MKRIVYGMLLLVMLCGAYFTGAWSTGQSPTGKSAATRKILYYVDPMHPAYKSDKPGIAPDCGMELVPVYEEGSVGGTASAPGMEPGTVTVSREKQQLIGVKVARVEKAPATPMLRALGRVIPDETRLYRINAATDGWVKKMLPVTTDSFVQKDELLATFYAPEFFSAMKAYLYGLRSFDRFAANQKETKEQLELTDANIENYRNALRNLGMSEHQLDEIKRTRQGGEQVEIRAPEAGFILVRNITLGERFVRGTELYRIADLSKVWIAMDTYGTEASSIKAGMRVRVSAAELTKSFFALVTNVPAGFDPATRVRRVRLQADNPGLVLRPDMFVNVEVTVESPSAIVVPADAVVDSGAKKTVYVVKEDGVFEPRKVETGWRAGDQVEIVKGLMVGEQIVVSGTFLIDSESRMKAAAAGIYGESSEDPVCGVEVDHAKAKAAGRTAAYQGQTYYFSSDECKVTFDTAPAKYAAKGHPDAMTPAGKHLERIERQGANARELEHHEHARSSVEHVTRPAAR